MVAHAAPSPTARAREPIGRYYIMLFVAQLAMGSGGVFGHIALKSMGALSVAAWRLGLAASPLAARSLWRLWTGSAPRPRWRLEARMGLAGAVLALHFVAWTGSLLRLPVGTSTLLVCTAPLYNGLYEAFVLRRHLPRSFWAALTLALGGVVLICSEGFRAPVLISGEFGLGATLALMSGAGMATYFILVRHITTTAQKQGSYDTFDIIARTYSAAALVCFSLSPLEDAALPPVNDLRAWGGVLGLAAITQGMGHTLQNAALRHVRASLVGLATLLEPLVAAVVARFAFDERLGPQGLAGGGLVLVALGWALHVTAQPQTG